MFRNDRGIARPAARVRRSDVLKLQWFARNRNTSVAKLDANRAMFFRKIRAGIVAIVCNSGYVYAPEVVTGSCLVGGKKAEIAVGVVPGDCHWGGGGWGHPFEGLLAWQDELAGSSPRALLSSMFGLRHQAPVR
jgi:hypothetical protein